MVGDSNFDYIGALKYDRSRIELKIIRELLKNPKYEIIRDYLMRFKYGIIYMSPNCEDDLLSGDDSSQIELYSSMNRNAFLPSYKYLDEAVLIYPSNAGLAFLENVSESFIGCDTEKMAKVVITIIRCLTSFLLCDKRTVKKCNSEIDFLMNSELVNPEVQDIIDDIAIIIEKVQNSVKWSR